MLTTDAGALDQAHVLRPWAHMGATVQEPPLVVTRGEGCDLWDASGAKYLDAVGGLWCTNIGLGRREMAAAIATQAERLAFASTFVDMTTEPTAALAARLAELAPEGLSHVHFTTGGSSAIDSAYRMACFVQAARGHVGRTHVIARQNSYHGSTFIAMSIGLRDGDRAPEFPYERDRVHHVSAPYAYRPPFDGDLTAALVAELEAKIAEVGADKIAAFFAEPIQASGGVLVPPDGYLRAMWEVCQRHGILFVADEVVTAFGRLGHWFVSEARYGVRPDIICCAKGLTSGYQPLGAVIFSDAIWATLAEDPDRWYTSGFTYSGHPVACAAALKNIEIMERDALLDNAVNVGAHLQARLGELRDLPIVGDVRGEALIACVENVADQATGAKLPDEVDIGRRVAEAAQSRGLFVRPIGHLNVMSPALILTESQADFIAETLRAAIVDVTDGLVKDGIRIG